jgi:hypothetical protein
MTISRQAPGFGLSSIAQSFCRAVFNQVPSVGISQIPAAERQAMSILTPEERDALAMERVESESGTGAVLKDYSQKDSPSVFVTQQSFPILTKFQTLIESIEDRARQRVLAGFTEEERMQLFVEEADYARDFAKFQKQAQVLNSKPGQWKIYLPCPPRKGAICQRFEREMLRTVEKGRLDRCSAV